MPKTKSINLLPQNEFDVSVIGRVLHWAMGTFRIIVIITEMIVMGAFISRFWLDAQNSAVSDNIRVKAAQISAQSSQEKRFREIQSKVNIYKAMTTGTQSSQIIDSIVSNLPPDVTLTGISITANSVQVKGTSPSDQEIAQFIANLKTETLFKTVDLDQVSLSQSGTIQTIFTIQITY